MPNGKLMFELAIAPFIEKADRILFAILKEHDDQFKSKNIIKELVPSSEIFVIDEVTRGPAETVLKTLEHFNIDGPFLVKDADSYFYPKTTYNPTRNYVSVCNAREVRDIKLYNKSFSVINEQGYVVGTMEKEIRSEFFSSGGYFFSDPKSFKDGFQKYKRALPSGEYFLSQIIDTMVESGHIFLPMFCSKYEDWGTNEDWIAFRKRVATYIIDIDGVIYENGSRFWKPRWGESKILGKVQNKIKQLFNNGNYIVLLTSRPEIFRLTTENQLKEDGIKYHQLVMGVHHGNRVLINDFSTTNPFPSAIAINTLRNSADFLDKI